MISLRDASVVYAGRHDGERRALDGVTLEIAAGEWISLVGGNGSGKTTLLKLLAGVIPAVAGSVEFDGETRPRTAFLLQEPDNQFVATSVRNELELSVPEGESDGAARVTAAADRFHLVPILARNPHKLSGGEKQRLALATVWLQDPQLLLLDEPTSYLDTGMTAACLSFIHELHDRGVTIVWATPGGEELAHAEEIVCLEDRRVGFRGTIDELYRWADTHSYSVGRPPVRALAEEIVSVGIAAPGDDAALDVAGTSVEALAHWVAERVEALDFEESPLPEGEHRSIALSCEAVSFAFGRDRVFRSLTFAAGAGDVVGITGANASGKSTLLLLAGGVHKPSSGQLVRTTGRPFFLPQTPEELFFAETVQEELAFGLRGRRMDAEDQRRCIDDAMAGVGLDPAVFLDRFPFHLSLGEMRRVAFAIARVIEPDLLLLDEPTSCLDAQGIEALRHLVRSQRERGTTVLIASHDTSLLCDLCDRVVILGEGQVAAEIEVRDGLVSAGAVWPPGTAPLVIDLQSALSARGVRIWPHAATPAALARRVTGVGSR